MEISFPQINQDSWAFVILHFSYTTEIYNLIFTS